MRTTHKFSGTASAMLLAVSSAIAAQAPHLHPLDLAGPGGLAFTADGPVLRAHTEALKPFTVAGPQGVLVGQQDGTFEAWLLPLKLLSHLTIQADIEGYTVPIDVNAQSAEIEIHPDRTILTYSHIGFTVRQIMFSPDSDLTATGPRTGPIVLFQFDCVHPTDFTLRFTPELRWMWPERNEGVPGMEWINGPALQAGDSRAENDKTGLASSGFYVLHSDYPDLAAAVALPGAVAGILAPYQERPQVHPVEFHLHIDPTLDRNRLYPLLMAYGADVKSANSASLGAALQTLNDSLPQLYAAHAESYRKLLANSASIDTPDKQLDEAFQWAVLSIEQLKAHPWSPPTNPTNSANSTNSPETALVAGYFSSGDSARPGFGWFFGRDSLYTLYAVNGYGDFALSRSELEFLMHRQRPDGKIMHEYSQTAAAIDWQQFPYEYAAADSTPLFLMAVDDYVRASGDMAFLTAHRDAIEKAWAFETSHAGDNGIYTNEQGTGWVESWPGGMPHQEIYLALLDQQASAAMAQLERLLGNSDAATSASARAQKIAVQINAQFPNGDKGCYAFSRNKDGSLDRTTTVYPALAWWSDANLMMPSGAESMHVVTGHEAPGSFLWYGGQCLQQFASAALNTDWGSRDVSNEERIYDGMSYHQGSVWPLFTGWAALAEYRGNQPLAGYQMLKENANLTTAQDLGAVTELLSGDYFVPFGRSTSHQLWSSAMVITPTLRGLFGISIDAQKKEVTVNPHLPAFWNRAGVNHIQVPGGSLDLLFTREGDALRLSLRQIGVDGWSLRTPSPAAKRDKSVSADLMIPQDPVQISVVEDSNFLPGARTEKPRVIQETWQKRGLTLTIEGPAGSSAGYLVSHKSSTKLTLNVSDGLSNHAEAGEPGGQLIPLAIGDPRNVPEMGSSLQIHFPPGEGWKTITVTLTW